ncbi:MAG: phosphate starvation-inducible protein PsiF [Xanthobacteraceae bacterium]|nr:phosphate starvation-inducible protein PsiF [Xanthobacteraceae bacterium]
MVKLSSLALATAVAALLLAGPASAQSAAPAAPATTTAPKAKTTTNAAPKERSAVSLECSKQADAKGLHGKEHHKFRAECKKNGGKAM